MREREKVPYKDWPEDQKQRHRNAVKRWRELNPEEFAAATVRSNMQRMRKYHANRDAIVEKRRALVRQNPEKNREGLRRSRAKIRNAVFDHYGWLCKCCNEKRVEFLTIDHINGDGAAHRRKLGGGKNRAYGNIYGWLVRNNFPEGFQTLCYNCNCSKGRVGYCPHERERLINN